MQRRFLFVAALMALVISFLEMSSFALLSLVNGHWTGWGDLQHRRGDLANGSPTDYGGVEALRTVGREPPPWLSSFALHPFLGFVWEPSRNSEATDAVRKAVELGFDVSAAAFFEKSSDDRLVIAVFGGSVANRFVMSAAEELRTLLAAVPNLSDKEIVIGSAAIPGYKQPQQLMAMNFLLANGAHFDVVINIDGFNEVALAPSEQVTKGIWHFYPRDWYYRVADLSAQERGILGHLTHLRGKRAELARKFSGPLLRLSLTGGLLWHLLDARLDRQSAGLELELLESETTAEDYQTRGPSLTPDSEESLYRELAEVWWRSSMLMNRLSSENGMRYFHFIQPNQYVEGSKPLSAEERRRAFRGRHPYRRGVVLGYPELLAQAQKSRTTKIAFHDLTGLFEGLRETLYVDSCCHFNHKGNRLLAEAVAAVMREE